MLPYIHVGSVLIESYTLFINLGTVIGAFVMYWLLDWYCSSEKRRWKIVIVVLAVMGLSMPFARILKGLFRNGNGTATHFLGRVLVACVVMEIVFHFFWKDRSSLAQAGNSVVMYLAIQHLFNRIACYMNGCCGGVYISSLGGNYPSQLIEAGCMMLLIVIIGYAIFKQKSFYYQFYMIFSIVIFVSEFFIEDTRMNVTTTSPLTGIQAGAIVLFILAGVFYMYHLKTKKGIGAVEQCK